MQRTLLALATVTTLMAFTATRAQAKEREWVKLGERTVEFRGDHDVIELGKSEGKFSRLQFKVEDGDLILDKIKITFVNGEVFEPGSRHTFKEGERSHEIGLPDGEHGRTIRKVEFFYRSEHRRDKATILLYGKEHNG